MLILLSYHVHMAYMVLCEKVIALRWYNKFYLATLNSQNHS